MKSFTPVRVAVASLVFIFVSGVHAAESLSVLLQKGIYAEETEGNLDSAIKIYEQIATEGAANRGLIAQAQYRLAVCYQKQGKKEQAIALLNELAKLQPSNDPLVEKAEGLLAQYGVTVSGELPWRKLPRLEARWLSCISPDGGHIAFVAPNNVDLCVYECASGKTWKIGECDAGSLNQNFGAAIQDGVFSPDGKNFALAKDDKRSSHREVWVFALDGTTRRKVYDRNSNGGWLCLIGWSPDSTQLMSCAWETPSYQSLLAIDANSGSTKLVRRVFMDPALNTDWRLSWDGRYLAVRRGVNERWIALIDLNTGREEKLVERDVRSLIGWTGDNQLLFRTMRPGSHRNEYWAAKVNEGKAAGAPAFIGDKPQFLNEGNVTPLSCTRDGSVFFHVSDEKNGSFPYVLDRILTKKAAAAPPEPQPATEIPLADIIGENDAIFDRTLGFAATVPAGLSVTSAVRRGDGSCMISFKSSASDGASIFVIYRATKPWRSDDVVGAEPPVLSEVDPWLRGVADRMAQYKSKQKWRADYTNDPASFRPQTIGGHRALNWIAQFTRNERKSFDRHTFIYSDAAWALILTGGEPAEVEAVSAVVDRLIATVRLP